jgi:membrane protein YqaA with SNARE-associated domain
MTDQLLATLGLYGGTAVVCFISGLFPIINSELFLLGLSAWLVDSWAQLPFVALAAAIGQMTANCVIYWLGLGLFELPKGRWKDKIERARVRVERWKRRPYAILAVASSVGLPPLVLVALAGGALKISFRAFAIIGLAGRYVRFLVCVVIPWL